MEEIIRRRFHLLTDCVILAFLLYGEAGIVNIVGLIIVSVDLFLLRKPVLEKSLWGKGLMANFHALLFFLTCQMMVGRKPGIVGSMLCIVICIHSIVAIKKYLSVNRFKNSGISILLTILIAVSLMIASLPIQQFCIRNILINAAYSEMITPVGNTVLMAICICLCGYISFLNLLDMQRQCLFLLLAFAGFVGIILKALHARFIGIYIVETINMPLYFCLGTLFLSSLLYILSVNKK